MVHMKLCEISATRWLQSLQSQLKHRSTVNIQCISTKVLTIFSRPKPATNQAKGRLLLCAMLEENHMRVVVLMHLQKWVSVRPLTAEILAMQHLMTHKKPSCSGQIRGLQWPLMAQHDFLFGQILKGAYDPADKFCKCTRESKRHCKLPSSVCQGQQACSPHSE